MWNSFGTARYPLRTPAMASMWRTARYPLRTPAMASMWRTAPCLLRTPVMASTWRTAPCLLRIPGDGIDVAHSPLPAPNPGDGIDVAHRPPACSESRRWHRCGAQPPARLRILAMASTWRTARYLPRIPVMASIWHSTDAISLTSVLNIPESQGHSSCGREVPV